MIETCCEGLYESLVHELNADPAWARRFLRFLDIEDLTGQRLRRLADDDACGLVLDWQLEFVHVSFHEARCVIAKYHAHCTAPVGWRFGIGIRNGRTLIGVATVGNPVARALGGQGIVEVSRLCVRRDLPSALCWNAASMLYGWCAREAARCGWRKIVTYTRADELGTSLRAAGWTPEARVRGRGWHSTRRDRSNTNGWIDKVRWSRTLTPGTANSPAQNLPSHTISASTLTRTFEPL
ncbi:MAG TPA: XF1762 family protein [Acidisphaera sp.]|nr:XF1762 family protein [Acidisphaera sp.]